jgi:hypothetical protein
MDTKLKSDIAENATIVQLLRRGFKVLKPIGDRLPYDLAIDLNGKLVRIQIKSAWHRKGSYIVDNRRTRTNRKFMKRALYKKDDFEFAVLFISELNIFYIMPIDVFLSFRSGISLVETKTRQRKPRSYPFREAWDLLEISPSRTTL